MLALQLVVIVQTLSVDQGDITLAVLGDDLLGTALDLFSQFGKVCSGVRERNNVTCGNTNDGLLNCTRCAIFCTSYALAVRGESRICNDPVRSCPGAIFEKGRAHE